MKNTKRVWALSLVLIPLIIFSSWCGFQVHENSTKRAAMKDDFSHANSIVFGLFSANIWREEVKDILSKQIQEFDLTEGQDSILREQIAQVLYKLVNQAKGMVEERDNSIKGKVRKWAVDIFVDWDELRSEVPEFTETILQDIKEEETKESIKEIATQKVDEYADKIHTDTVKAHLETLYKQYGEESKASFNEHIKEKATALQRESYRYTYFMLGVVVLFLIAWFFTSKYPELRKPLFVLSVVQAMVILLTGLTSPMIEIDARIKEIDFVLLGEHILFKDQILFYRSKSILQVVNLLLQSSRIDSKMVGVLVLAFSVILPISKLISTGIKLLGKGKLARNKIIGWLAFYSGKWSMADVMVVAIFMAYVSFDGILDEQLKMVDMKERYLTSVSTNLTSLEPGFILFFAFVIYSLILSQILTWLQRKEKGKPTSA